MSMELIRDLECRRCKGVYQSNDRVMSILYSYAHFSVCPKCTKEIAEMMGYTTDTLMKELCLIKEAQTENNRKRRIEYGEVCKKCEKKFGNGEARVRNSDVTNCVAYHLECYEK